jgi:threonine dehydrogenase-like Zn-dependent dehydrogenase
LISAEVAGESLIFRGDLPSSSAAFVDCEWLPTAGKADVPALVVGETDRDLDEAAFAALMSVAREAAAAAQPGLVEVVGNGIVARLVRALVGVAPAEQPGAIVDTTGDPAAIASALGRVADLGTVVLAGESLGRQADLDLYRTVHVRGLTLVGIAPPAAGGSGQADAALLAECRGALGRGRLGEPVAVGAAWYRISGAETPEP